MADLAKPPLGELTEETSSTGTTTKATRRTYTLEFKLGVLEWVKKHKSSVRAAARRFGIHRRMVQRWIDGEAKLTEAAMLCGTQRRKIRSGRPVLSEELDMRLSLWLQAQVKPVSDQLLKSCALGIAAELGLPNFKASNKWLQSWKKRHNAMELSKGGILAPGLLPTTGPNLDVASISGDALLGHTDPNDTIRLVFIDDNTPPSPLVPPSRIYLDYSTPEHNYYSSTVGRELGPEDGGGILGQQQVVEFGASLDLTFPHEDLLVVSADDEQVIYEHEEVVGQDDVRKGVNVVVELARTRGRKRGQVRAAKITPTANCLGVMSMEGLVDGVLTVGNRLSQPIFTIGPELIVMDNREV